MKSGFIHFHQGWTDIINCLPLIKYYSEIYEHIYVLSLTEAKNVVETFCNGLNNVTLYFFSKEIHDKENQGTVNLLDYVNSNVMDISNCDLLIHGFPDHYRSDKYKSIYPKLFNTTHFVKGFYTHYDIPYQARVDKFEFNRNFDNENRKYEEFINKNGDNYILYHEDSQRNMGITLPIQKNYNWINLHGLADNIFETIKIIENANELHLVDSVWASFCYLIDAKYNLLKDKKVYLYPLYGRPGGCLPFDMYYRQTKLEPVNLNNWIINFYF